MDVRQMPLMDVPNTTAKFVADNRSTDFSGGDDAEPRWSRRLCGLRIFAAARTTRWGLGERFRGTAWEKCSRIAEKPEDDPASHARSSFFADTLELRGQMKALRFAKPGSLGHRSGLKTTRLSRGEEAGLSGKRLTLKKTGSGLGASYAALCAAARVALTAARRAARRCLRWRRSLAALLLRSV